MLNEKATFLAIPWHLDAWQPRVIDHVAETPVVAERRLIVHRRVRRQIWIQQPDCDCGSESNQPELKLLDSED